MLRHIGPALLGQTRVHEDTGQLVSRNLRDRQESPGHRRCAWSRSVGPPWFIATTGRPEARASRMVRPKVSLRLGRARDIAHSGIRVSARRSGRYGDRSRHRRCGLWSERKRSVWRREGSIADNIELIMPFRFKAETPQRELLNPSPGSKRPSLEDDRPLSTSRHALRRPVVLEKRIHVSPREVLVPLSSRDG